MHETAPLHCSHRSPDDDFFCEKYRVWYRMQDCNYRVLHRTFDGCADCFQGRVNLRGRQARPRGGSAGAANVLFFPVVAEATAVRLSGTAPRKR